MLIPWRVFVWQHGVLYFASPEVLKKVSTTSAVEQFEKARSGRTRNATGMRKQKKLFGIEKDLKSKVIFVPWNLHFKMAI